jgi:DNA-binding transcriptional MerR regulator
LQSLNSINCLKKTRLSLEDIKEFIQEVQCLNNHSTKWNVDEIKTISSRSKILSEHLNEMEKQRQELDDIIQLTKKKLDYYNEILNENTKLEEAEELSK